MGLFSRKNKDPFAAAAGTSAGGSKGKRRAEPERAWFQDAPESELDIEVNKGAQFTEADRAWLDRDPGEEIRRRKRNS
jgi:hypothetical protein